ncbi:MAG: hypothetical protein HRT41_04005 [Campylobacteraceae bacterium]|nr:hypothetical protein [Campylobacteraceae bacterium]
MKYKKIIPKELVSLFSKSYNIPENIVEMQINEILINEKEKNKENKIKTFFLYYFVLFFFLFLGFFGKRYNEKYSSQIIFEGWVDDAERSHKTFYESIHKELNKIGISDYLYLLTDKINSKSLRKLTSIKTINRDIKFNFSSKVSKIIFFNEIKNFARYKKIENKNKEIDIIIIVLKFLKQYALYYSSSCNIKVDILISAHDNGYTALKYFIFKQNGIKNIFLIQNGTRDPLDNYIFCDDYFAHSIKQIELQNIVAKNKYPIGSIPLYSKIKEYKSVEKKYDICFIEEMHRISSKMDPMEKEPFEFNAVYNKLIDNVIKFSNTHRNIKICFIRRIVDMSNFNYLRKQTIERLYTRLKLNNIYVSKIIEDSYLNVMASDITVFYMSTLGFEALGFEKKILNCNYNKHRALMLNDLEIGVVLKDDYSSFEKKLLFLIENNSKETKNYYENKKFQYMNINGDPSKFISNRILEETQSSF